MERGIQIEILSAFSIIGAGRLGVTLGRALSQAGYELKVISDRNPRAAREGRQIIGRGRATASNTRSALAAPTLLICVPDDSVKSVVREITPALENWSGRRVFHTSGLLSSRLLLPLKKRGARIASLHPVQTFASKQDSLARLKGITWGIEGDRDATETAEALVRKLGGHSLYLEESDKALYHTACSLASNALLILGETAIELLARTGLDKKQAAAILLPLMQGTLQNVKNFGLEGTLTGPVARGDIGTVRRHLEALDKSPGIGVIYRILARRALERGAELGHSPRTIKSLMRLLKDR